jgi:hypothetical protein
MKLLQSFKINNRSTVLVVEQSECISSFLKSFSLTLRSGKRFLIEVAFCSQKN